MSIQDIIPKSFQKLNRWTHCPGAPDHPFVHQFDLELWFDFICALHTNGEELSSGDLEQWLMDDNGWDEDVVTDTIIRYETERDLLNRKGNYSEPPSLRTIDLGVSVERSCQRIENADVMFTGCTKE